MIEPGEGRIVWFYPHADEGEPEGTKYAAIVAAVIDSRTVNLAIFNRSGAPFSRQAVQLLQDDDAAPAKGHYAAWMPFQKGQAASLAAAQVSPAPAPAAPTVDLQPVHDRIAAIEIGIDGKFSELGSWLHTTLGDLEQRISAVTPPPTAPAPAPAAPTAPPTAPAAAPAVGEATQQPNPAPQPDANAAQQQAPA